MSNLLRLTDVLIKRLRPFFPKRHVAPRVDDKRVLSARMFINRRLAVVRCLPLSGLKSADWLLAARGYNAGWFRDAVKGKKINPCLLSRTSRRKPVKIDKHRNKRRNRIEIMFDRPKGWRRGATRYDRCPKALRSAVAFVAIVMFWVKRRSESCA